MVRFVHEERPEIAMDYVNVPDASGRNYVPKSSSGEDRDRVAAAVPGRKLYRFVAVSFGVLCILQALLNISLRLALDNSDYKTPDMEASCKNMTEKIDELKRKVINFDYYFQQGWVYFQSSFYYISSTKKSWQDSRDYCLQSGADLMIINSKEEQNFTGKVSKKMWIGLTDRETKGTWKWVDSTPLTLSYWGPDEPNDYQGKTEDCVELNFYDGENSWNDIPCTDQNFWICEKTVAL